MKNCTLFVDIFGPCIQDGLEVKGAFEALSKLGQILGPQNVYLLGGLAEVETAVYENLKYLNFFQKTSLLEEHLLMFDQSLGLDAKFLTITQLVKSKNRHVCVIDDDIQVLGHLPREFLRVLLGYDQKEYISFEHTVLAKLSIEDAKKWDTLLIMPAWQVHFSILKRWVSDPVRVLYP